MDVEVVREINLERARAVLRKNFAGTSFPARDALAAGVTAEELNALIVNTEVHRGTDGWCEVRSLKPPRRD